MSHETHSDPNFASYTHNYIKKMLFIYTVFSVGALILQLNQRGTDCVDGEVVWHQRSPQEEHFSFDTTKKPQLLILWQNQPKIQTQVNKHLTDGNNANKNSHLSYKNFVLSNISSWYKKYYCKCILKTF